MYDTPFLRDFGVDRDRSDQRVRRFLDEHGAALETAASLLGGAQWKQRASRLRAAVGAAALSDRACLKDLKALLALLSLERVGEVEADETAYFAMVEPDDPRVHDLCLLCDRLEELVDDLSATKTPRGVSGTAA